MKRKVSEDIRTKKKNLSFLQPSSSKLLQKIESGNENVRSSVLVINRLAPKKVKTTIYHEDNLNDFNLNEHTSKFKADDIESDKEPNGLSDDAPRCDILLAKIKQLSQLLPDSAGAHKEGLKENIKEGENIIGNKNYDFNILNYNITEHLYNLDKSIKSAVQLASEEKLITYAKFFKTCYNILHEAKMTKATTLLSFKLNMAYDEEEGDSSDSQTDILDDQVKVNRLNDTYRNLQSNKRNSAKTHQKISNISIDEFNKSMFNEGISVSLPQSPVKRISKPSNEHLKNLILSKDNKLYIRTENNDVSELKKEEYGKFMNKIEILFKK
jgi:hypothetical protein